MFKFLAKRCGGSCFWSIIALQVGRSVDHFHKFKNDKSTAASRKRRKYNNDVYYIICIRKSVFSYLWVPKYIIETYSQVDSGFYIVGVGRQKISNPFTIFFQHNSHFLSAWFSFCNMYFMEGFNIWISCLLLSVLPSSQVNLQKFNNIFFSHASMGSHNTCLLLLYSVFIIFI